MLSDEEKDNVFKISVPIITNEELQRLDYTIKNDLDNIVHQISKTVSRDRDIIILKKVIEKQSKKIEELKITNKELTERVLRLESDKFWNNVVSKDKIKAKIEDILNSENSEAIEKLIEWQSLLEEE